MARGLECLGIDSDALHSHSDLRLSFVCLSFVCLSFVCLIQAPNMGTPCTPRGACIGICSATSDAMLSLLSDAMLSLVSDAMLSLVSDARLSLVSDAMLSLVSDAMLSLVSDAMLSLVSLPYCRATWMQLMKLGA